MPSMILSVAALSFAAAVFGAQAEYQQCGGIGWSGGTTCASPYVCTVLNNYYYQCLPGSSTASTVKPTTTTTTTTSSSSSKPTTTTTTTSSSVSSSPTSSTNPAGVPRLGGVNMAGFDFGVGTDGSFSGKNSAPPSAQFAHFSAEGVNFFRVPTAWQYVQPTPGGPLSSNISVYDQTMQTCLATGAYCILDIHNYARFNGAIVGQGGPTNAQFAQLWSLLATKYASQSKVIFGIMNEPHDLNVPTWATSVQGAVTAIRAAGAKSQLILIPGDQYTGTAAFPGEWGPIMKSVVDSDGTTSKLIFDLHRYLDSDGSGTHNDCVSNRVSDFQAAVSYLQSIGRQAAVTEIGGGPDQTCLTDLPQAISYIASAYPTLIGFAGWGAGGFDNTYNLDLGPTPNYSGAGQGTDSTQWVDGFKPYLP